MQTFTIEPSGPFSLRESAMLGFGQRHDTRFDGVMRLALCLDGYQQQVGVEVRQPDIVQCIVHGSAPVEAVKRQLARVLSLDHDAQGYVHVGDRDPVVKRLLDDAASDRVSG